MDTPAQAQLRAAMARYMAAEGEQTLPADASMDTPAQAQLRAAMARYMAAEGDADAARGRLDGHGRRRRS